MKPAIVIACVALCACMKIYPDPELPDVSASWYAGQCDDASTPNIRIVFTSLEDASVLERTVACTDERLEIADVQRHRYRVDGELLAADGSVVATAMDEVDLRNSINKEAYLYFDVRTELWVAWEFDMGASCGSLGASYVLIDFYADDFYLTSELAVCASMFYSDSLPGFSFVPLTVELRAVMGNTINNTTVAISPRSPEFMLITGVTDLGTFVLTPCGATCPPRPSP